MIRQLSSEQCKQIVANIRTSLKDYMLKNPALKSLVLGVSGGVDSALTAVLARPVCDELGIPLIGVSLTITSNKPDEINRSELVGNAFCSEFWHSTDLEKPFRALKKVTGRNGDSTKISLGNIKARLRMIYLYDLAGKRQGMVLGTDNLTEYLLSFWTRHGDDFDYNVIHGLWKTEVYAIADYLVGTMTGLQAEALQVCIDASATDGLGVSKTDIDQIMPAWKSRHATTRSAYAEVDDLLAAYTKDPVASAQKMPVERNPVIHRHLRSAFKRALPISLWRETLLKETETLGAISNQSVGNPLNETEAGA